jgi:hypothetical protein
MQRVRSGSKENERNVQGAASTAAAVDKLGMVLDRKRASFARAVMALGHSPRQHARSISAALSCMQN